MNVLVIGSNGQVGRALYKQFKSAGKYKVTYAMREQSIPSFIRDHQIDIETQKVVGVDYTKKELLEQMVIKEKPDILINCAAHTGVDLCETQVNEAYQLNAYVVSDLAQAAQKVNAKFIHISTDYVFDGKAKVPYQEEDETNPQTVYGKSKLLGEREALKNCDKTFIIRTAWVYGDGKNFVKTMLRLAGEHPIIKVVGDQYGSPTSAKEVAKVIIHIMESEKYGIYHATCEGVTTWYGFAEKIFEFLFEKTKKSVNLMRVTTDDYKTVAKRPAYSVLENKNLKRYFTYSMMEWEEALNEYLEENTMEVF